MGLFSRFRSKNPNDYPNAGAHLMRALAETLPLEDWRHGVPDYTVKESDAINRELSSFQRTADAVAGGPAVFHPGVIEPIRGTFIAQALKNLANQDSGPSDWKNRISTYLKAWMACADPEVLLEMAHLLAGRGYAEEAKRTYEVVLLFPGYAPHFFGKARNTSELVEFIVERARSELARISAER